MAAVSRVTVHSARVEFRLSRPRAHRRRGALHRPARGWLDDDRIAEATHALQRLGTSKLIEANAAATTLLLEGTVGAGVEGWDQGRGRTIQCIDWERPDNNTFRVIDQLRVDQPGGHAKKLITPDLVLFVDGIPLVVVECKAPGIASPLEQAIDQLQR